MTRLLNVPETADNLRLSERKVWQLIADGDLRVVRIGGRVLIRPVDLAAFIDARVDGPNVKAAA
jgi:excisionase family DNA binding protein